MISRILKARALFEGTNHGDCEVSRPTLLVYSEMHGPQAAMSLRSGFPTTPLSITGAEAPTPLDVSNRQRLRIKSYVSFLKLRSSARMVVYLGQTCWPPLKEVYNIDFNHVHALTIFNTSNKTSASWHEPNPFCSDCLDYGGTPYWDLVRLFILMAHQLTYRALWDMCWSLQHRTQLPSQRELLAQNIPEWHGRGHKPSSTGRGARTLIATE